MGPLPVLSSAVLTGSAQQSLMGKQWHMLDRYSRCCYSFCSSKLVAKKTKTSRDTWRIVESHFIWHFLFHYTISDFTVWERARNPRYCDLPKYYSGPIPDPSSNPPPQFWSYSALKLEDDGTSAYHDNLLKTITFYYVPRSRWTGNWINLPSSSHQAGVEFKNNMNHSKRRR